MKHRFLKQAKKTSYLVDLVDRYKRWKAAGGEEDYVTLSDSNLSKHNNNGVGEER